MTRARKEDVKIIGTASHTDALTESDGSQMTNIALGLVCVLTPLVTNTRPLVRRASPRTV